MSGVFMKSPASNYWPTAARRSNIIATSMGICFQGCRPILESCYGYPYSRIKGIPLSLASQMKRGVKAGDAANSQALVHSQWSRGYYHWLTESLPRAMVAKELDPKCRIMLPKSHNCFHPRSLELLGFDYDYFPGHNINITNAIITSCPKTYASTHPDLLNALRFKLRNATDSKIDLGKKIYISRKIARGRKILNEGAVSSFLKDNGFVCITPESYSFEEQVSIFSNAKVLVGIHGAGLANMLFMEPDSSVIEILPYRNGIFDFRPNSMSIKHDHCYSTMAKNLTHKYFYLQCSHNKMFFQRTHLADLKVDIEKLRRMIDDVLE